MLAGVLLHRDNSTANGIRPYFVNRFIVTDVLSASLPSSRRTPLHQTMVVSISTLVSPIHSLLQIVLSIIRTAVLVFLSWLPGPAVYKVKRISVANTNVLYHDGRALATCESGPPMRIALPGLETVGWWNGSGEDGSGRGFNKDGGFTGFLSEWTTAHVCIFLLLGLSYARRVHDVLM